MARKKGSNEGSVYYRKDRGKWIAQYYNYHPITLEKVHKEKSFSTEEEAKLYLKSIMFQKENPIFIEKHRIPLKDLMKTILQKKYETNMIFDAQYERVQRTIKIYVKVLW